LPIRTILSLDADVCDRFLVWIRKNEKFKEALRVYLNEKEYALRNDSDFQEVIDEDLDALAEFRKVGDLGEFEDEYDGEDTYTESQISRTPTALKPRTSMGSSVSSIQSIVTGQTSLSPIREEGGAVAVAVAANADSDDDDGVEEANRLEAEPAHASQSKIGHKRQVDPKGSDRETESDESSPVSKRRRTLSSAHSVASNVTLGIPWDSSPASAADDDENTAVSSLTSPKKRGKP
jgi:vacuolar-type H+-ATPase subunit I/STV1